MIGNHDLTTTATSVALKLYLDFMGCTPSAVCPSPFYSFNKNNIHFLIMDSETKFDKDSNQYSFVNNDLEKASSDPSIHWIIVAHHSTMYASINLFTEIHLNSFLLSAGASYTYKEITKQFLDIYHPLFDKYGVDLVLQAHVHDYQRTYPLKFDTEKAPIRTSAAKNGYHYPEGEICLTVGTAGVGLDDIGSPSDNSWISNLAGLNAPGDEYYVAKADSSNYGYLNLEFSKDGCCLLGTFYGNDAEGGSKVLDQFTIDKVPPIVKVPPVAVKRP